MARRLSGTGPGTRLHVLNTETLLTQDIGQYKLLYLPVTYLIPREVGDRLSAYVEAGGTLVSECRPAYVGADGWMYLEQPGAGLHEVFGAPQAILFGFAPSLLFPVGGPKYEGSGDGQAVDKADQRTGTERVCALADQAGVSRPVDVHMRLSRGDLLSRGCLATGRSVAATSDSCALEAVEPAHMLTGMQLGPVVRGPQVQRDGDPARNR